MSGMDLPPQCATSSLRLLVCPCPLPPPVSCRAIAPSFSNASIHAMASEVQLPGNQPAAAAARQPKALAAGSRSFLAAAAPQLTQTRLQQAEASPPSSPTQDALLFGQKQQGQRNARPSLS
ncbi:hypothetical protein ABPG77_002586 [Micractinium sp. CCAP 211/92]